MTTPHHNLARLAARCTTRRQCADLITPLRDLLTWLDHATGSAARAAERYPSPSDVARRSAYRAAGLDVVLDAFARLRVLCGLTIR